MSSGHGEKQEGVEAPEEREGVGCPEPCACMFDSSGRRRRETRGEQVPETDPQVRGSRLRGRQVRVSVPRFDPSPSPSRVPSTRLSRRGPRDALLGRRWRTPESDGEGNRGEAIIRRCTSCGYTGDLPFVVAVVVDVVAFLAP